MCNGGKVSAFLSVLPLIGELGLPAEEEESKLIPPPPAPVAKVQARVTADASDTVTTNVTGLIQALEVKPDNPVVPPVDPGDPLEKGGKKNNVKGQRSGHPTAKGTPPGSKRKMEDGRSPQPHISHNLKGKGLARDYYTDRLIVTRVILHVDTTTEDIAELLRSENIEWNDIEKLPLKFASQDYSSFHLTLLKGEREYDDFYKPELWPKGSFFKRWSVGKAHPHPPKTTDINNFTNNSISSLENNKPRHEINSDPITGIDLSYDDESS
ncbi:unnamed protein product [Orchesella dallaii]|uniref:Uncharacterized protein n=1 Tax=Orchesella dallaii TaxID=48710 RepID=A0ABP1QX28_9HEXA